jgi:antitoxin component YwqK of YwqJK toxin-antitoxin module
MVYAGFIGIMVNVNGILKYVVHFQDGKKHGNGTKYNKTGVKVFEGCWAFG